MATGVRSRRAAKLIRLHDGESGPAAIAFLRTAQTVHVVAHITDWPRALPESHYGDFDAIALLLGDVWTVCGTRIARHVGGFEHAARHVDHFPDDLLCQPCHAAFGDRAALLFELNQPPDPEEPEHMPPPDIVIAEVRPYQHASGRACEAIQWNPRQPEVIGAVIGWLSAHGIDFHHPHGYGGTTAVALRGLANGEDLVAEPGHWIARAGTAWTVATDDVFRAEFTPRTAT